MVHEDTQADFASREEEVAERYNADDNDNASSVPEQRDENSFILRKIAEDMGQTETTKFRRSTRQKIAADEALPRSLSRYLQAKKSAVRVLG